MSLALARRMSPSRMVAGIRARAQTTALAWRLRFRAWRAGGKGLPYVTAGPGVARLGGALRLAVPSGGGEVQLFVGDDVRLGRGASLLLRRGVLYLGSGTEIGPWSIIEVDGAVILHDGVRVGTGVHLQADGGEVELHAGSVLGDLVAARASGAGSRTTVGPGAGVGAEATLLTGADVRAGATVPPATVVEGVVAGSPSTAPRGLLVSVVVSTKDRAAMLPRLLAALSRQTLPPDRFELVIVDNGSSDRTTELLRSLAPALPFEARVLRREPPGGPARGRNAGWQEARAPVVAFTDDDCAPAPGWLERGLETMHVTGAALVQGRTIPEPRQIGRLRGFALSQRIERESGNYETCNMLYRREVLEAVGGFGEDIPVPAGEDTELAWRARSLGYGSAFARSAVVHHVVQPTRLRGYASRFRQWAEVPRVVRRTPAVRQAWPLGFLWAWFHAWFLLALVSVGLAAWLHATGSRFWYLAFVLALPYARFLALVGRESTPMLVRVVRAPLRIVTDAVEVGVLAWGSLRHRAVLL